MAVNQFSIFNIDFSSHSEVSTGNRSVQELSFTKENMTPKNALPRPVFTMP